MLFRHSAQKQLHEQQLRLKNVKNDEWEVALDALTVEMSKPELLGGQIVKGPHNTKRLVNGKTHYGAHSEYNLATSNVLYHYQAEFVLALYEGEWEWKEGVSLADQLIEIANSRIPKVAKKYTKKKERENKKHIKTTPVSLDVDLIGKPDDYTGEETETWVALINNEASEPDKDNLDFSDAEGGCNTCEDEINSEIPNEAESNAIISKEPEPLGMDYQHQLWEKVCAAADGDKELEEFVQITGECTKMRQVNERLHLEKGDRDRLQKRLKRKVNKL